MLRLSSRLLLVPYSQNWIHRRLSIEIHSIYLLFERYILMFLSLSICDFQLYFKDNTKCCSLLFDTFNYQPHRIGVNSEELTVKSEELKVKTVVN